MKKILALMLIMIFSFGICHAEDKVKIGVVLSIGGLRDHSFNDATYDGIEQLRNSNKYSIEVIEPSSVSDIVDGLEYFCQKNKDLIVAVGFFANNAISFIADKYKNKKFVLLDSVVHNKNVLSILFDEEQGSFYAGTFAALITKTNKVGFVGGMQSPTIESFESGFEKGVKFIDPTIKIVSRYVGNTPKAFNKPNKAFKIGLKLEKENCDIVYHASGKSGIGLIDVARRGKFLLIGVDSDQSIIAPGRVPASVVKRLDNALVRAIAYYELGKFHGGVWTMGIKDSGVELVLSRFNKPLITGRVRARLNEIHSFLMNTVR